MKMPVATVEIDVTSSTEQARGAFKEVECQIVSSKYWQEKLKSADVAGAFYAKVYRTSTHSPRGHPRYGKGFGLVKTEP